MRGDVGATVPYGGDGAAFLQAYPPIGRSLPQVPRASSFMCILHSTSITTANVDCSGPSDPRLQRRLVMHRRHGLALQSVSIDLHIPHRSGHGLGNADLSLPRTTGSWDSWAGGTARRLSVSCTSAGAAGCIWHSHRGGITRPFAHESRSCSLSGRDGYTLNTCQVLDTQDL